MRDTSRRALAELEASGVTQAQQQRILLAMRKRRRYSRTEISQITGLPINAVTGRVNALVKLGALVEREPMPCRVTGRTVYPVVRA